MNAPANVSDRMSATGTANALELRNVSKLFGALAALQDINITVRPGERRAVLGSNGAGKTALFNCVTGDFLATTGAIRFFGEDISDFPPHERIRRGLRRTYQISLLFTGLSVRDNIYLACVGVSRRRRVGGRTLRCQWPCGRDDGAAGQRPSGGRIQNCAWACTSGVFG